MEKWMIVDGSNLLFQMFYGMPARITGRNGNAIQGTLGFVGALLKMLRMVSPTHIAVLFDGECANERRELDADYKANRPDYSRMAEEDTPFSQLPDIFAALTQMGIPFAETTDCEADDWIAGYAAALPEDAELVIASQDSDFFQLIGRRVSVLRMAVIRSAVAVVDVVPEPALVGVLEHRFVVHHAAQVNEIGARKGIIQRAAHGLRTVLCGCGAKVGVKLVCHSNASFQTPRTCVRAMV